MSLFLKFKKNLQKTSSFLSTNILSSFQNNKVDSETLEELESILISADMSLDVVEKLINSISKVKTSNGYSATANYAHDFANSGYFATFNNLFVINGTSKTRLAKVQLK